MNDNTEPIPADDDGLERYTEPPPRPTESNIASHAWDELNSPPLSSPSRSLPVEAP